jgi:hypothetical protein
VCSPCCRPRSGRTECEAELLEARDVRVAPDLVRAIRADPELESLPVIVQTSDRSALRAPVWRPLRVSHVMDKMSFVDWFESQMRDLPPEGPPRGA